MIFIGKPPTAPPGTRWAPQLQRFLQQVALRMLKELRSCLKAFEASKTAY